MNGEVECMGETECFLPDERSPQAVADDVMRNIGFWEWIIKTKPDRKIDIKTLRDIYNAFDQEDK